MTRSCGSGLTGTLTETQFVQRQIDHWNHGGLVGLSANWPTPVADGSAHSSQDGIFVDPNQVIDPNTAVGAQFKRFMDRYAADVLLPLKAAEVPALFRPFPEFDGGWFWWGYTSWTPAQYIAAWRYTWNYLTTTKGCDHLVWMYAANGGPGPNSEITNRYPGDKYVDGVGIDVYTSNPTGDGYPQVFSYIHNVAPTKFVAFTEVGSGTASAVDPNFDARIWINGVKNRSWGAITYFDVWITWDWRLLQHAREALTDPIVLNRDNMNRGF